MQPKVGSDKQKGGPPSSYTPTTAVYISHPATPIPTSSPPTANDKQSIFHGIIIEKGNPEEVFEVESILGRGNFGTVYKGRNRHTGEVVAIKQILLVNEDEIESLQDEVRILYECRHDNIVAYRGTYKALNALWIVMEYCAGGSVDSIFRIVKKPLCEVLIAYVMREVLKGMVYLHGQHKIHRDIKGGNILLTEDGSVKLADFGVSTQLLHTLSRRNSFIGTLYWMAPEAIMEREYDERVDIWSLGITLIEIAESVPPNTGLMCGPVLFKISKEPPPTLRDKDLWSPLMHKFLARMLAKDPALRPTAAALLEDPFITQERIGTAAELMEVIMEVRELANGMSTARRLGDESSGSSATFVEVDNMNNNNTGSFGSVESGWDSDNSDINVKGRAQKRDNNDKKKKNKKKVDGDNRRNKKEDIKHTPSHQKEGDCGKPNVEPNFFHDGSLITINTSSMLDTISLDDICGYGLYTNTTNTSGAYDNYYFGSPLSRMDSELPLLSTMSLSTNKTSNTGDNTRGHISPQSGNRHVPLLPSAAEILTGIGDEALVEHGGADAVPCEGALLHSTRMLLAVVHYHKHVAALRGLNAPEDMEASQATVRLVGAALKTVLRL